MIRDLLPVCSAGAMLLLGSPGVHAAPDWSKVPSKTITVFYPGVATYEWVVNGSNHSGAQGMKQGESCAACHDEEAADVGRRIVSGGKLEPHPIKGKAGSIPVTVQAAHDGTDLWLRFQWKDPAPSAAPREDDQNQVKIALMLENNRIELGNGGCWATCHSDLRSMPDVNPDAARHPRAKEIDIRANGPTKYIRESRTAIEIRDKPRGGWDKLRTEAELADLLKEGKFLYMMQYRSSEKPRAGYVLGGRFLKAAEGAAEGHQADGVWTVTFTRKLAAAGPGDFHMAAGRRYNFGFAIHSDWANERHHHVSLGYTLDLDDPRADVRAVKQ